MIRGAAPAGLRTMRLWAHDRWRFPLPERHRFPIDKYALLRERVVADGIVAAADVLEPAPVPWVWLEAVHDGVLVARIRDGSLTLREAREAVDKIVRNIPRVSETLAAIRKEFKT